LATFSAEPGKPIAFVWGIGLVFACASAYYFLEARVEFRKGEDVLTAPPSIFEEPLKAA
jgi:hypothetical protein